MTLMEVNFSTSNNFPVRQSGPEAVNFEQNSQSSHPETVKPEPVLDPVELTKLTDILAESNISLKFSRDVSTNAIVVEMVDEGTGEAIRQFPTEVSLTLAANFIKLQGQFLDKTE